MNLYIDEMMAGIQEVMSLYKQGASIFEMGSGNLFPNLNSQKMWQFSRGEKHLHLSDGEHTYSFHGDLADEDTELEKMPDVPLPDLFKDSKTKGKAQVHRADPGSIYFTLQEGTRNPTYTFRHVGNSKWKAIPKKRKVKEQISDQAVITNVNAESLKEGMAKFAEEFLKDAQGGVLDFLTMRPVVHFKLE
jgi:hypothetical protein